MERKLIKENWLKDLAEDLLVIITEKVFESRWALIEGYHHIGRMILETQKEHEVSITDLVQGIAVEIKRSERMLWYAVKLYEKYPNINKLPEGKNISLHKLITKYLSSPSEKEKEIKCKHCPIHCKI